MFVMSFIVFVDIEEYLVSTLYELEEFVSVKILEIFPRFFCGLGCVSSVGLP